MARVRAVVTGAAGFIGSHLCDRLLADGHSVVGVDNLATGRLANLEKARKSPRFSFVTADVSRRDAKLEKAFAGADWAFHLAGLADIVPSIERPGDYFRANVEGTFGALEAARGARVKRFVYAASSSCYGLAREFPTSEKAEIRPEYPYAMTKRLGEELVLAAGRLGSFGAASLRLFNVYGPRSRTSGAYGAVFGVFLAQRLAGKPLTVVGDGSQVRDFVFVSDVVDAFVRAAAAKTDGEVYNVGAGAPQPVMKLAGLIGGPVVHLPKRPGEPDRTHADTRKIRRALGWQPRVRFEDGVRVMLENIERWKDAPVWTPKSIEKATKTWFEKLSGAKLRK